MVRFASDDDARRLGEALAALRRDKGLSQAEAGARIGMTSQGWGLYESGRRSGLYRPDIQRRLAAALEATPEDLLLKLQPEPEAVKAPADGVESGGRAFRTDKPADVRMIHLTTDEMAPWAAAGVTIAYRPGQAPKPGQGCVLRLADGRLMVRLFAGEGADGLTVRTATGDDLWIDRREILEISAIVGRLEDR